MKILYLVSGIGPPAGWGTEFIQDLIFSLSSKGVEATIIHPILKHTPAGWREWAEEQEKLYKIKIISLNSPSFIKANLMVHFLFVPFIVTFAVLKELASCRYDLIHEFSSTPIILLRAGLVKLLFGIKTVFTLSVLNTSILGSYSWFKVFNFAKFYLIPSREIINILIKKGIQKDKIIFSPPGLSLQKFSKLPNPAASKKKLKISSDKFIVSYFGPLTAEKGLDEILNAAKVLEKEEPNIKFYLFTIWKGSSEHQRYLKTIKLLSLSNLIIRHEFIDISDLLASSNLIVLPYRTGFGTTIPPISVCEVAASNTSLITTQILGLREWVEDTNTTLISPRDYHALVREIFSESKDKKKKINTDLAKKLSLESSANLHLSVYKQSLL